MTHLLVLAMETIQGESHGIPDVKRGPKIGGGQPFTPHMANIVAEAERLKSPFTQESTALKYKSYHDKYDSFLQTICKEKTPTKTNINNYIAYLSLCGYSGAYINNLVCSLIYYPQMKDTLRHHLRDAKVCQALHNIHCRVKKQDTQLPATEKLMNQLCRIFDRDLGPYKAILIKAVLWLALNCMLRISEYAETIGSACCHVLPYKDVIPDEAGILVNFSSHKWCQQEKTLYFPYLGSKGQDKEAIAAYLAVRPDVSGDHPFLLNPDCTPVTDDFINKMMCHGVEHSDWYSLKVTSHSMQIGGATVRYKHGTRLDDIKRLGRWRSDNFQKYIREGWLQKPDILRSSRKFVHEGRFAHHLCLGFCPKGRTTVHEERKKKYAEAGFDYNNHVRERSARNYRKRKAKIQDNAAKMYMIAAPAPIQKAMPRLCRCRQVKLDDGTDAFQRSLFLRDGVWPSELLRPPILDHKYLRMSGLMSRVVKYGLTSIEHARFPYHSITAVPVKIQRVRRFLMVGLEVQPYRAHNIPVEPEWLEKYFQNDRDWFAVTVFFATLRIHKVNKLARMAGKDVPGQPEDQIDVPNTKFFSHNDKMRARKCLTEYRAYDRFFSAIPVADWHQLPPFQRLTYLHSKVRVNKYIHPKLAAAMERGDPKAKPRSKREDFP